MPGGNTRTGLYYAPFPLTMVRGAGASLWDADGHRYIDFVSDFSAGIFGHSNAVIRAAVTEALASGMSLGAPNRYERELAELVCRRFPSIESVRFCNSGTEANLLALCAARTATNRNKVLGFRGAYHGSLFTLQDAGRALRMPFEVLLARYNLVEEVDELVERHGTDLAAIIVEPMIGNGGCIPGTPDFLLALRRLTEKHGIVLIFDEVITSRLSPGGLQQKLAIKPDITTLGKYIGGGFSFGAFGGSHRIMKQFDQCHTSVIAHSGTFNNNVASMAAGVVGFGQILSPDVLMDLNAAGDVLRSRLQRVGQERGVPFQVSGLGSVMNIHFYMGDINAPEDLAGADRELLRLLHLELLNSGFHIASRGLVALSLPLTKTDLDAFVSTIERFVDDHKDLGNSR